MKSNNLYKKRYKIKNMSLEKDIINQPVDKNKLNIDIQIVRINKEEDRSLYEKARDELCYLTNKFLEKIQYEPNLP